MTLFRNFTVFFMACALAACGTTASSSGDDASGGDTSSDASGDTSTALAIAGVWSSNFGGYEDISASAWDEMTVVKLDTDTRMAITQNAASDKYSPSTFGKIVWTAPNGGSFYYCMVDYGLATADLASATTKTADDSAPDKSGCGGFSWTKLTTATPIAIAGKYTDSFGGKSIISSRFWDTAWIVEFDNAKRVAITQNAADDKYNPSKFSKVVWTAPAAGSFYTCTVDYGLDSAALASATTKTADDSAPDKSGCGGFSWTKLTPQ